MTKKILVCLFLALALAVAAFAAPEMVDVENAEEIVVSEKTEEEDAEKQKAELDATEYTSGYYTYTVSDGKVTITNCDTSISGDVTIPSTLSSFPVTSIGGYAFEDCTSLTSIEIPASVTSIGDYAFYFCKNLTNVTFGKNSLLMTIGKRAFSSCKSLTKIEIPASVTSIGNRTFSYCDSLASVTFGENSLLMSIGDYAFYFCKNLASVTFGKNSLIMSIGNYAFSNCTSLTSIEIPASVTSIGNRVFYYCKRLTNITVDGNNANYANDECGVLFNKVKTTLIQYPIGSTAASYEIPASVTSIGGSAFYSCDSLASIKIPECVTSIGTSAFYNCKRLASITVDGNNANYANDECGVLFNKVKTTLIQYPIGNTAASYEIPASVTSIGKYAFSYCTSLTSIKIPDSVASISGSAFSNCTSLVSITVDGNNANYANDECGVLFNKDKTTLIQYPIGNTATSYEIPDSVTSIGDDAFFFCDSLVRIEIPASVTSIGDLAFYFCENLVCVTFGDNSLLLNIGNSVFYSCDSLASIEIPASVTSIGESSFSYCTSLASIEIPDSVTNIGDLAFSDCTNLKSIEIPASVTSIGYYAFENCKKLTIRGYADSTAETYAKNNSIPFEYISKLKVSAENGKYTVSAIYGGSEITGNIAAAMFDDSGKLIEIQLLDAAESVPVEFKNEVAKGNVKFMWLSESDSLTPMCKNITIDI